MPDKLATDVEILKREVADMKLIHGRLDNAITKITDVSNSINRMLAVHEEKLASQEDEFQGRQIGRKGRAEIGKLADTSIEDVFVIGEDEIGNDAVGRIIPEADHHHQKQRHDEEQRDNQKERQG